MLKAFLIAARTFLSGIPWQFYAIAAAIGLLWASYALGDRNGHRQERAAQAERTAEIRAARIEAAKKAAAHDAKTKAEGEADITTRREELDNATQDIPDKAPSARQLERARIERMRNP